MNHTLCSPPWVAITAVGLCLAYDNELRWLGYSLAVIHTSSKSRLKLYDSLNSIKVIYFSVIYPLCAHDLRCGNHNS